MNLHEGYTLLIFTCGDEVSRASFLCPILWSLIEVSYSTVSSLQLSTYILDLESFLLPLRIVKLLFIDF